jgi:hypothetical protein
MVDQLITPHPLGTICDAAASLLCSGQGFTSLLRTPTTSSTITQYAVYHWPECQVMSHSPGPHQASPAALLTLYEQVLSLEHQALERTLFLKLEG